jgi:hypothetical protein
MPDGYVTRGRIFVSGPSQARRGGECPHGVDFPHRRSSPLGGDAPSAHPPRRPIPRRTPGTGRLTTGPSKGATAIRAPARQTPPKTPDPQAYMNSCGRPENPAGTSRKSAGGPRAPPPPEAARRAAESPRGAAGRTERETDAAGRTPVRIRRREGSWLVRVRGSPVRAASTAVCAVPERCIRRRAPGLCAG